MPGRSLNRDVLDRCAATRRLGVEVAEVVVEHRAGRQQAVALKGLPVLARLGWHGGAQHVRGAADGAELQALVLGPPALARGRGLDAAVRVLAQRRDLRQPFVRTPVLVHSPALSSWCPGARTSPGALLPPVARRVA